MGETTRSRCGTAQVRVSVVESAPRLLAGRFGGVCPFRLDLRYAHFIADDGAQSGLFEAPSSVGRGQNGGCR